MAVAYFYVGQRLTNYSGFDLHVEEVKEGGFGVVALGIDQTDGLWQAVKILKPDLLALRGAETQERLRSMFLRESLTWCGLWPHANLLTAQFVTVIDEELVLVLDYAEKGSLRDRFTRARQNGSWLTLGYALTLAQMIAAGLVVLHTPAPDLMRDDPIVHRDLKPENILINTFDFAQITDFGMAKAVAEALTPDAASVITMTDANGDATPWGNETVGPIASGRTQAYRTQRGVAMGTPAYMAPEQWVDAALADCPADAYAFGVILAELLSNRHPLLNLELEHSLDEWRQAHLSGRPIPLRKLGADMFMSQRLALTDAAAQTQFDSALIRIERLLARLLAKLPAARPPLSEALAELQQAARELDIDPYIPPDVYPRTTEHEWIFWKNWAVAYRSFGQHEKALPRIQKALALAPRDPGVLTSYANILGGLGRFAEAEAVYAEHVTIQPESAIGWFNRSLNQAVWARAETQAGDLEVARAHATRGLAYAERAAQLNPESPRYPKHIKTMRELLEALSASGE